ncbi:MAG: LysE/ArgO family amino acid transporter [Microbacteriaceae bacterium]
MFVLWLSGLGFGLGLIVAVGAQNAFVLRQGLTATKRVIAAVVLVCVVADISLMAAGVAGMGALIASLPWLMWLIRYTGAAFLIGYGILAVRRAMRSEALLIAESTGQEEHNRLGKTLLAAAAFTFLNPNVYLDTLMLVGGIANQQPSPWVWAAGAMTASTIWFISLGFGARALRPLFAKPLTWRIFDSVVAVIMFVIAFTLIFPQH